MKIVILGFDGLSPDLAFRWADQGRLPHLKSMMNKGAWGPLRSVVHPITPAAWTSMVTGTNPGRHGIFDFGIRCAGGYEPRLATSRDCLEPDMFRLLSQAGKRVGVLNVPLSYPPSGVHGFMMTGMHTPHLEAGCYPKALAGEIRRVAPDYAIDVMSYWYEERNAFVSDAYRMLEARRKVAMHLWSRYRPDLFMAVFVAADRIQHALWAESFPPSEGPADEAPGGEVFRVYQALDDVLGEFLGSLAQDEVLFLVSDHGFGPLQKDVYLNAFLESAGLLRTHTATTGEPRGWKQSFARRVGLALTEGDVPVALRQYLGRIISPSLSDGLQQATVRRIDWSQTKAYSHGMFGNIYINTAGREPEGIVNPGKDYEDVVRRLMDEVRNFRDPEDGQPIVDHVFRRDDLYHGQAVEQAPDLVLVMRDYAYMTRGGKEFAGDRFVSAPNVNHTGNHRLDGCFAAVGPGVASASQMTGLSLMDLCPTVLGLMGVASSSRLDGMPMHEVFPARRFLIDRGDRMGEESHLTSNTATAGATGMTAEEQSIVESRLRGLGYLD